MKGYICRTVCLECFLSHFAYGGGHGKLLDKFSYSEIFLCIGDYFDLCCFDTFPWFVIDVMGKPYEMYCWFVMVLLFLFRNVLPVYRRRRFCVSERKVSKSVIQNDNLG